MNNLVAETISQTFSVSYHYPVVFTEGVFNTSNSSLIDLLQNHHHGKPQRVIVAIDEGVACAHPALWEQLESYFQFHHVSIELVHAPLFIEGGEAAKNSLAVQQHVHDVINDTGLCRQSYVIAIGGGAVQDAVGYAAATAHRGIRLVRIPTTVLAQCDAAIGVKNGINAFGKKNFLGTFSPPYGVINDCAFLTTLKERDWRAGVAEAVKVALIKDGSFFQYLSRHAENLRKRNMQIMQTVVYRCAALHLEHIATSGDPFEKGSSRPLDFGHWAAHKLEQLSNFRLRHGEAVAIGIALDSTYCHVLGKLSFIAWQQILHTLETMGFSLWVPELNDHNKLFQGLAEFQEHIGGELTLTLLDDIGESVEVHEVDLAVYQRAIGVLQREVYKACAAEGTRIAADRHGPSLGHLAVDL